MVSFSTGAALQNSYLYNVIHSKKLGWRSWGDFYRSKNTIFKPFAVTKLGYLDKSDFNSKRNLTLFEIIFRFYLGVSTLV